MRKIGALREIIELQYSSISINEYGEIIKSDLNKIIIRANISSIDTTKETGYDISNPSTLKCIIRNNFKIPSDSIIYYKDKKYTISNTSEDIQEHIYTLILTEYEN